MLRLENGFALVYYVNCFYLKGVLSTLEDMSNSPLYATAEQLEDFAA